jgi:hypothetical protein
MKCNEFESIILALAGNQLMDARQRELGLAHAESCADCGGRLASERFLSGAARAVVAEIAAEDAPARVEAALLAAFREQVVAKASTVVTPIPVRINSWLFWRSAVVAALILILISTMAVFWLYSNSLKQTNEELTGLQEPIPVPELGVAPIELGVESVDVADNAGRQGPFRQRVSRRKSHQAEEVTQFYPLVQGEDLDSSEVTQVVRVELPASALSAAGVSVGPDMSTVPVKADVALGYDGVARAIRFVR